MVILNDPTSHGRNCLKRRDAEGSDFIRGAEIVGRHPNLGRETFQFG